MVVFGVTVSPGRTGNVSTRPLVVATLMRMCSGESVPGAFTEIVISPFFTVSIQSVARSTGGAAGLRPLMKIEAATMTTRPAPQAMYFLVFFGGSRLTSNGVLVCWKCGGDGSGSLPLR